MLDIFSLINCHEGEIPRNKIRYGPLFHSCFYIVVVFFALSSQKSEAPGHNVGFVDFLSGFILNSVYTEDVHYKSVWYFGKNEFQNFGSELRFFLQKLTQKRTRIHKNRQCTAVPQTRRTTIIIKPGQIYLRGVICLCQECTITLLA